MVSFACGFQYSHIKRFEDYFFTDRLIAVSYEIKYAITFVNKCYIVNVPNHKSYNILYIQCKKFANICCIFHPKHVQELKIMRIYICFFV